MSEPITTNLGICIKCMTKGTCDYSLAEGEVVIISTDDGSIQDAQISIKELTKLLRFRQRQLQRQNGDGAITDAIPAVSIPGES